MPGTFHRRAMASGFRESIHDLNQSYRQEWERAERLEEELNHIKGSRAYRLLCWWRRLAARWRAPFHSNSRHSSSFEAFPSEILASRRPATGTVSIVIPFKDRLDLLRNCLRSLHQTTYQPEEICLLDNGSTCSRTLRYLEQMRTRSHFQIIPLPGPFNFARLCNSGAQQARGDFLLFLNNDVEVLAPDWLEHLLQLGNCPDIGVVGATLLYPNRTIQHAGIFPCAGGQWGHVYRGQPHDYAGASGELRQARTVPAVTGACLLIRRRVFLEMGGFDEQYAVTFNDVDLCFRIRRRGLKVAISPQARLWHFESLSRKYSRD